MKPSQAIDRFLEATRKDIQLGAGEVDLVAPERYSALLEVELQAAQASAVRWNWLVLLILGGIAGLTIATEGAGKLAAVLGAGGFGALLVQISRRKFAVDLLIALLKETTGAEERRKLVEAFRGKF